MEISIISGTNNRLLVVAPHREETGTGKLARKISKRLGCPAVINERIKRNDSDLSKYEGAIKHPDFMTALNEWAQLKRKDRPLAIWLQGDGLTKGPLCVVGDGQPLSSVASPETVDTLVVKMEEYGVECVKAVSGFGQYSAQASNNMTQYFKRQGFAVDSIQLELSKQLRGMFLVDFAEALSNSLQAAIELNSAVEKLPAVKVSVEQAASTVIEICSGHLYEAALDVGKYFVKTLYEGNYERARDPRTSIGPLSFHKVCARVHQQGGPSIRWLYSALKLAVNEHDYGSMKAYGKLSLSKKIALFKLDDHPEAKRELINDAVDEKMTTRKIKDEADERYINLLNGLDKRKPYEPTLEEKEKILTNKIERRIRKIMQFQDEIDRFQAELDSVRSQLHDDRGD